MAEHGRAQELAGRADALARAAGVDLPADLQLWALAGGRTSDGDRPVDAAAVADPAADLVAALEERLTAEERRQGAHYTPPPLADELVARAGVDIVEGRVPTVVDPSCGGGAVLLAAARRLAAAGAAPEVVARDHLFGADLDPLAAAVTEAALALWSGGVAPERGHIVVADPLVQARGAWDHRPAHGFDRVVGNPPFQSQLAAATARSPADHEALRDRFGPAIALYVDTAAVFLLAALDLAARGGRVALLQPQSTVAARDAGPVREELARRARLVDLWVPTGRPFAARVHVCVPVLEVGLPDDGPAWTARLAAARGVPAVEIDAGPGTVGDLAGAVAGFRQHYYGLVAHVLEDDGRLRTAPLVTSGALGVGRCEWGNQPSRFARRSWERPVVDLDGVREADDGLGRWLDRVLRPKVVVASQTRVVEAAVDRAGGWVPSTPVVCVVPGDPADLDRLLAVLCAPPVAAWMAARASGSGLSPDAIRMSTSLALAAPLPVDEGAWRHATADLLAGDLAAFAASATAMYALPAEVAEAVQGWWESASR